MNRIGDFALIGDCHSAALVGRDGRIEWACFPRFDSPAVFASILDAGRGGSWAIGVAATLRSTRAYAPSTNVLVTTFETPTGVAELTDCMPVEPDSSDPKRVRAHASIQRSIRCVAGRVEVATEIAPRFEYGAFLPRFTGTTRWSAEIVGGADALYVHSTRPVDATEVAVTGRWTLAAGDEVWIDAVWRRSYEPPPPPTDLETEGPRRLAATVAFWRTWLARGRYEGVHRDAVSRSALVLKALTYAPSGAIVAAPTTSLPEQLGGSRNWDYRFTWIRDATLALTSLLALGFIEEADAFKLWLERAGAGRPGDLQIMYGIGGERWLPELALADLAGHRGSAPVRIGNGAVKQMQLDAYGQILEAAYLYRLAGGALTERNWRFLAGLVDIVSRRWQEPDRGIWEIRDDPRHFTHSKAMCWLALRRGVQIAELTGMPGAVSAWAAERERVRVFVLDQCAPAGWFQQAAGRAVPDASTLLLPAIGILPARHPVVIETVEVVRRSLERDGLVRRYLAPDGLAGGEGAFLLCSFWLVDYLTHAGRLDEAEALLSSVVARANDVGLFSEQVDAPTGELLGNFPQAFSHMALVTSAEYLNAARERPIPTDARDYAELAIARMAAVRGSKSP